jgi:hypothetical protein
MSDANDEERINHSSSLLTPVLIQSVVWLVDVSDLKFDSSWITISAMS